MLVATHKINKSTSKAVKTSHTRGSSRVTQNSALSKGDVTKALVLDAALYLVGRDGFEGLSIGRIADRMQMSKSGVYAHFESKENIQIEVIQEYHRRFRKFVFEPALQLPRGLPRLRKMLDKWIELTISEVSTGCIYISGAFELDDQPGPVRDELSGIVTTWRKTLIKAIEMAINEGHLKSQTNPKEMLFSFYSVILGIQHDSRFLKSTDSSEFADKLIKKIIAENKPKSIKKALHGTNFKF
jgi:AcrR family transcriptional regulator